MKLKTVTRNPAILASIMMVNGIFKKDDNVVYRVVEKKEEKGK